MVLAGSVPASAEKGVAASAVTIADSLAALGVARDSLFVPPAGQARILRDRYGVPHIYGETDVDVAFGFGFAQAQDHLIPMLLNYRAAGGRLSEVLGQGALESDYKALLWRIHSVAGERYGSISEPTRDLIGAFVKGINHYIEVHRQALPGWVEAVSGTDVVALSRWLNLYFSERTGWRELAQKGLLSGPSPVGSNQWVVGPSRSSTGSPIFVMDLHLPWRPPLQMYEAHLVSREGLNVAGATFFGLPVVVVGHTDRIAWSMTVNDTDVFDLYEEKLDPANPRRYLYEREKQRMSSRRVKIRVRQEKGTVEVKRELLYTHHGPVYKVVEDWAYAARSSMQDVVNTIGQLYAMNRAQDLNAFRRAMAQLELPMFHVMYGDVDGNLFYVFNARCPTRAERFDWRSAVPGWTVETEWGAILEFNRLPQVTNPPSGFMQNCNVAAHLVTVESGLDPDVFPAYLGWGEANDRGRRALGWLFVHPLSTVGEMRRMARDEYLIAAEELKGIILRAYNRVWQEIYDPDGRLALAVDLLRNWDNRATVESRGTLLFSVWKERFDPLFKQNTADQRRDMLALEKLALEALRMAVEYMMETYGRLDVRWGEVHVIDRGGRIFPVGGSPPRTEALHTTWAEQGEDGLLRVIGGSAFTMVVSLSQPVQAWSLLPYGNSEDARSPHYSDQAALQGREGDKPAWFGQAEIARNLEAVTTVPLHPEEAERVKALWRLKGESPESPACDGFSSGRPEKER